MSLLTHSSTPPRPACNIEGKTMVQYYELRDSSGILKAKVPESIAEKVISERHGSWGTMNHSGRGEVQVFTLEEDVVLTFSRLANHGEEMTLFFWSSDRLELKE